MTAKRSIRTRYPLRTSLASPILVSLAGLCAAWSGCAEPTSPVVVRILDRPTEVSFACVGQMRLTNGGFADPNQPIVTSPVPLPACAAWNAGDIPEGQEAYAENEYAQNPHRPTLYAFFLQSARGSVAVARYNKPEVGDSAEQAGDRNLFPLIQDADRFAPGDDTIPVGSLPIGLETDRSGCHLLTANAGSCDLSSLDVATAVDSNVQASIRRVPIVNAAGEAIGAKPHSMVGDPRSGTVGIECPDRAEGLLYITYPDCGMVAAVDAASGEVVAGILFHRDGRVEITDGHVSCAGACGAIVAEPPLPGEGALPRPITLEIDGEDQRLYIGLEENSSLVIADLSEDLLPVSVSSVALEGEVGLFDIAVTDLISFSGLGTPLRFVYAVASDQTVRVVEVEELGTECETQADTRYLHEVRDTTFLPCMPVGDPRTPPRRLGAHSPGIHTPDGSAPLAVAFAPVDNPDSSSLPLDGYAAYVTTSRARVHLVDVNNDTYPNTEPLPPAEPDDEFNPFAVDIALALPHTIRHVGANFDVQYASCQYPDVNDFGGTELRPRLLEDPQRLTSNDMSSSKGHLLPNMRRLECVQGDTDESAVIPELSLMADVDTYKFAYPDFRSIPFDESWAVIWEGPLTLDSGVNVVDGPSLRDGTVSVEGGIRLHDPSGPFCRIGVEPYDIIDLAGCDPARGNADCAVSETCYVHPDAPSNVTSGMCLPSARVDTLSGVCEELLTSRRAYTAVTTERTELELVERRRVLRTTPASGCLDTPECYDLYREELGLASADHPVELAQQELEEPESLRTFSCEPDPSRAPGPPRCIMTCQSSDDCENGFACSDGYCVSGPEPPAACMEAVQRYRVRAGESFSVVGTRTGYLHPRIVDPDPGSDACIVDPDASPLSVGRIRLDAPPCSSDDITEITPNPCLTVTSQAEGITRYDDLDTCSLDTDPNTPEVEIHERLATAIRFRNPVFTMHMADPYPTLDASCNGDRLGPVADYPVIPRDYVISFRVIGGYVPFSASMRGDGQSLSWIMMYPAEIERGPWGDMWIIDQGDRSSTIRGQVVWFSPSNPSGVSTSSYLR